MRFRRFIAIAATVSVFAGGIAHAGQYDAEVLGQSLPMWMETLASINDEGDVAWTAWDGTSGNQATTAKFYNAANPDHTLNGAASSSWAVGISEQVTDGGNTVVGIAGSTASSQRLTDRSAVLWDVRWSGADGVATSKLIDLGAVTDGTNGPVQQSAAYGVLARQGNANNYYVGGYARDKVDNKTFPQPVIWTVENANTSTLSIAHEVLPIYHPSATNGSGYVSSIAQNDSKIWACGNSTDTRAYNQATCWDMSGGPASATVHQLMLTDLDSSAGFPGTLVSSMIHRVRVVPIGPNGALHTVAVGAALVNEAGARRWKGFVYDLDAGVLYKELNLSGQNETLAYDVAALTYQGNNNGTPVTSQGMIIAGISSTASPAELGGLQGGPVGADTTKMTGVNRRMTLSGITDNGQVCAINDDSEFITSGYDQLLALSPEGDHRLAMSGNQLVLLTSMPEAATVEVRNRDATERKHHYVSRTPIQYHQIQASLINPAHAAVVRFGSTLSCDLLSDAGLTGCGTSSPAAFEINSAKNVNLNSITGGTPSATVRGAKDPGLFNANNYAYAQVATRNAADCTVTPVQSSRASSITVQTNPAQDFDGMTWLECGSNWVDPKTDYDHCSGCNQEAVVTGQGSLNTRPLSQCLWGQCVNGAPIPEADMSQRYKANTCHIDNTCFTPNEGRPIAAGAETATNFCRQCQPSTSQSAWTTTTGNSCCNGQDPIMSGWHSAYRPAGNNISYNGSTLQSTWVRRIQKVTDGGYWEVRWAPGCQGPICYDRGRGNKQDRVRKLTSSLSAADPEDWYVFSHLDENEHGEKKSYPRIRVKPRHNQQITLCAYPRCIDMNLDTNTEKLTQAQRTTWATGLLSSIGGARRTRGLEGVNIEVVDANNSPLREDGVGLPGVCITSAGNGGAADLAFMIEDYNSHDAFPECWNMDWFVQIKPSAEPSALSCNSQHDLFWGNWLGEARGLHTCRYRWYSPDTMEGVNHAMCDNSDAPLFLTP